MSTSLSVLENVDVLLHVHCRALTCTVQIHTDQNRAPSVVPRTHHLLIVPVLTPGHHRAPYSIATGGEYGGVRCLILVDQWSKMLM